MAVMKRCFFFMIVFTLFMPLMGLSNMKSFFAEINQTSMVDWPSMVSKNMLNQYDYFSVYFIQLTFVSGGFWILDLTHKTCKMFKKYMHDRQN